MGLELNQWLWSKIHWFRINPRVWCKIIGSGVKSMCTSGVKIYSYVWSQIYGYVWSKLYLLIFYHYNFFQIDF